MKIVTLYDVIEHYGDGEYEPFGGQAFAEPPKVGDRVRLRWLDGSPAHEVIVARVDEDRLEVTVEPVPTSETPR